MCPTFFQTGGEKAPTYWGDSPCTTTNGFLHLITFGKDHFTYFKNNFQIIFPEYFWNIPEIKKKYFRKDIIECFFTFRIF